MVVALQPFKPFLKYFKELVATEIYNDVLFLRGTDTMPMDGGGT